MGSCAIAIIYFNGEIISDSNEGVIFRSEEPAYFSIPYAISFSELRNELCQCINANTSTGKVLEKIMYRSPISFFRGLGKYQAVSISDEHNVEELFRMHKYYLGVIHFIELYVIFKDVVAPLPICNQVQNKGAHNFEESDELNISLGREVERESSSSESDKEDFESDYRSSEEDMFDDFEDNDANNEEVSTISQHPNQNPYNGSSSMPTSNRANEFQESANKGAPTFDDELFVGKQFNDREAVTQAIKCYSISKGVDYKVYESEPTTFYCKCTRYGIDCFWLFQVSFRKNKHYWEIRKYNGGHTCTRTWNSQDHTKLDSDIIAQCIVPMIQPDPSIKVKSIVAKVQSQYGYTISYQKAWMAKQKAMEKVFGNWEQSYKELPRWCKAMCASVQGSIVLFDDVEACQGSDLMSNVHQLRRVFWSFDPCIKAFRHCKPLIQVDGTHLCGKYKGVLLIVIAQDGNKIMFPVAFAIVEGETADAWYFFLDNLRKHVVTRDRVCIIYDCHKSTKAAIARSNGQWEPPKAFHMYCLKHIASDFLQRFNEPDLHKLFVTIGNLHIDCTSFYFARYSRTKHEFKYHYEQLRKRGKIYTDWLDEIPREKWVQAFDKGHRWGHMTTNQVECINALLKGVCYLPMTQIVSTTYFRLDGLFKMIGSKVRARKITGNIFSESMVAQLQENEQASSNICVIQFDRRKEIFRVQELCSRKECRLI